MAATSPENPSHLRVAPASPVTRSNERTNGRTHVTPNDDCAILEVSDVRARVQANDTCSEENCDRPIKTQGICSAHHSKRRRAESVCSVPDCGRPLNSRGLCSGHYTRLRQTGSVGTEPLLERRGTVEQRFWNHVNKTEGCWEWAGSRSEQGYGRYSSDWAHRLSYEINVGPIPEGLHIDHLCRNPPCVNPAHLEPVTRMENLMRSPFFGEPRGPAKANARKTHCKRGHEFTPENTMRNAKGHRKCRTCANASRRKNGDCEMPRPTPTAEPTEETRHVA